MHITWLITALTGVHGDCTATAALIVLEFDGAAVTCANLAINNPPHQLNRARRSNAIGAFADQSGRFERDRIRRP